MGKIPFILVTGFLGSGKTTLLKKLLTDYSHKKKILLVQNEFAETSIDSKELLGGDWNFSLLEMNKGSLFCVCLFSDFKRIIVEQIQTVKPDMVVIETTGIADPIAVSQLLDDDIVCKYLYLSYIWSVIDASTIHKIDTLRTVINQIRVADTIVVNKCDLTQTKRISEIDNYLRAINPFADIEHCSYCAIDLCVKLDAQFRLQPIVVRKNLSGDLTKCNQSMMTSMVFKSSTPISKAKFEHMLTRLNTVTRLKGFVNLDNGECFMIQYSSGRIERVSVNKESSTSELIAIATSLFDFDLL